MRPSSSPPWRSACNAVRPATGNVAACASLHPSGSTATAWRAAIDPLGPGARRQDADDAGAGFRAAAVRRLALDDAGEIPARPPARRGKLQRAPGLAAIERDRGDPDLYLVAVRVAQFDRPDRQFSLRLGIDDNGADLCWHWFSPPVAAALPRFIPPGTIPRQAQATETNERGPSGRLAR